MRGYCVLSLMAVQEASQVSQIRSKMAFVGRHSRLLVTVFGCWTLVRTVGVCLRSKDPDA